MTTDAAPSTWPRRLGVAALLLAAITLGVGCHVWPALGAAPRGERLARAEASPQYRDGRFRNALPTLRDGASVGTFWEFAVGGSDFRRPGQAVPVVFPTAASLAAPAPSWRVTWLGHSTLLVQVDGAVVLVDPVWGERASPAAFAGPRRFYAPLVALDSLPPLDAVVISHDHYDHLDMPTVRALARTGVPFVVPLGVGAHLERWGVPAGRITELDWWDETTIASVRLVSTPARHFSGRSLADRDRTLWSGWAIVGPRHRVFYSGDTALTPSFAEVGRRLGPFDAALVESGAYNAAWADVHLGPEQAVAVHRMVRSRLLVPVHWGLFDLSLHGWTEPGERVRAAAERAGVPVAFPRPGESVSPGAVPTRAWWPSVPWRTAEEAPALSSGLPESVRALIP